MSANNLNIAQRIALELLWGIFWLLGHLPHFLLFYILAPSVRFVIYRIFLYRVGVVNDNLKRAFPSSSERERKEIRDRFYTILSEVIVSIFVLTNADEARKIISLDEQANESIRELKEQIGDRSWIALTAHFGLWEYMLFWTLYSSQDLAAVYHPLKNRIFDELFCRLRSHRGVIPLSPKESLLFVIKNGKLHGETPYLMGLIADQNPPNLPDSEWYSFLNQDTRFFSAGEKIALRIGLPVNFIYQRRISAGRYEIHYIPIWDGEQSIEPQQITQRYVELLEQAIKRDPAMWLWSHKRWKGVRKTKS